MFLSIVIPAYNEEERIGNTLQKIHSYLNAGGHQYEVIVVDDGSQDRTEDVVLKSTLNQTGILRLVKNESNRGKGFSVKRGILASKGEYLLISDADLSTPIEELDKLYTQAKEGYEFIIGSRSTIGSDVRIHQPWYRELMGKIFNLLVRIFVINEFNDTQCGFKLLKGELARDIAFVMKLDGFSFDVEMLYLAKKRGKRIKEAGVIWNNSPQSRVSVVDSSFHMFLDLLRIKALHK